MQVLVVAVIVAAIGVSALTDEEKQKKELYSRECINETKVDESLIEAAQKGIVSDDPKLKKYAFCFAKKCGFQNERGEIQLDVIRKKLSNQIGEQETVEKLIDQCILAPEETAYRALKCLHENNPKKDKPVV